MNEEAKKNGKLQDHEPASPVLWMPWSDDAPTSQPTQARVKKPPDRSVGIAVGTDLSRLTSVPWPDKPSADLSAPNRHNEASADTRNVTPPPPMSHGQRAIDPPFVTTRHGKPVAAPAALAFDVLLRQRPRSNAFGNEPVCSEKVRIALERILEVHEAIKHMHIAIELYACGAHNIPVINRSKGSPGEHRMDDVRIRNMTALAQRPGTTLEELVKLVRGETETDPRPNKALRPKDLQQLLQGYKHVDFIVDAASFGLNPRWLCEASPRYGKFKNHQSANRYLNGVVRSVRGGQDDDQYLVVDKKLLEAWPSVQISPFGAVEKKGVDPAVEVRLIHDLSYPKGGSVNDATDRSDLPAIQYAHVATIARRIDELASDTDDVETMIMTGDVKGAFRHLRVASKHVSWMGALINQLRVLVIDMSAPFGWTCSPTYYGAFGGAITWLVARESPASMNPGDPDTTPFFSYEWVDDHVMVERNVGNRLQAAATALRLSMMAVLGPRVINEEKFSDWSTKVGRARPGV